MAAIQIQNSALCLTHYLGNDNRPGTLATMTWTSITNIVLPNESIFLVTVLKLWAMTMVQVWLWEAKRTPLLLTWWVVILFNNYFSFSSTTEFEPVHNDNSVDYYVALAHADQNLEEFITNLWPNSKGISVSRRVFQDTRFTMGDPRGGFPISVIQRTKLDYYMDWKTTMLHFSIGHRYQFGTSSTVSLLWRPQPIHWMDIGCMIVKEIHAGLIWMTRECIVEPP